MTNTITNNVTQCSPRQCLDAMGEGQTVAGTQGADSYTECGCNSATSWMPSTFGATGLAAVALFIGGYLWKDAVRAEYQFDAAAENYASKLHNDWRATRNVLPGDQKAIDGQPLREPRWRPVASDDPALTNLPGSFKKVAAEDGRPKTYVDIANLDFAHLPEKYRYENLEAAKGAMSLIKQAVEKLTQEQVKNDSTFDPVVVKLDLEEAAAKVHDQWLERRRKANDKIDPALNVPYARLSEEEKAKDRAIVIGAFESLVAQVTKEDVLALPPITRGMASVFEQEGDILMKQRRYKEAEEVYRKAIVSWRDYPIRQNGIIDTDLSRGQPRVVGRERYVELLDKTAASIHAQAYEAGDVDVLEGAFKVYYEGSAFMSRYMGPTDPTAEELRGRATAVKLEMNIIPKFQGLAKWGLLEVFGDVKRLKGLNLTEHFHNMSFDEFYGGLMMGIGAYDTAARAYLRAAKDMARQREKAETAAIAGADIEDLERGAFDPFADLPKFDEGKYIELIGKAAGAVTRLSVNDPKGSRFLYKAAEIYRRAAGELGEGKGAEGLTQKAFDANVSADVARFLERNFAQDKAMMGRLAPIVSAVKAALEDGAFKDKYLSYDKVAVGEMGVKQAGVARVVIEQFLVPRINEMLAKGKNAPFAEIAQAYATIRRICMNVGDYHEALIAANKEAEAWFTAGNDKEGIRARKMTPKIIEMMSRAGLAELKEGVESGRIDPASEEERIRREVEDYGPRDLKDLEGALDEIAGLDEKYGRPPRAIGVDGEGGLKPIGAEKKGKKGKGPGKKGKVK